MQEKEVDTSQKKNLEKQDFEKMVREQRKDEIERATIDTRNLIENTRERTENSNEELMR